MGLIPGIPDLSELTKTIDRFQTLLVGIDAKMGQLLDIERAREARDQRARDIGAAAGASGRALGVTGGERLPYRVVRGDGSESYPQAEAAVHNTAAGRGGTVGGGARGGAGGGTR